MCKLRHALLATACSLSIVVIAPYGAAADPGSLYQGPGPRPGPDILYAKPAWAPQLTNAGVWAAKTILISGASAYRQGEFLYTFQARQWDIPATQTPANRLDIEAENVRSVTINPWRAKVDCDADMSVTTDGRLAVKLAGCGAPRRFGDWP